MPKRFHLSLLAIVIAGVIVALSNVSTENVGAHNSTTANAAASSAVDAKAAADALEQGRALLGRNRSDQALPLLESALKGFTAANDGSGMAAAHDALGDIYLRHGQHASALEHFQRAAEAFRAANETANAALMFAKLGETYYLAGDETAARAAFARVGETPPSTTTVAGANADNANNSKRRESGSVAFASISAALPGLASCASLKSNNSNSQNQSALNNAPAPGGNNATSNLPTNSAGNPSANSPANPPTNPPANPPANPPTNSPAKSSNAEQRSLGHAPKGLDGIGRMDLRVVDPDGNPVKGAKARLSTKRPNGFDCDCWEFTNPTGQALMPPIHVGKVLKLEVKAPGYQSFEQVVPPEQLGEPFTVTLQPKGGAKSKNAHAVFARPSSANMLTPPVVQAAAPGACLDFSRLFVAYGMSEFGLARADFKNKQLGAAQTHYQNVLNASDKGAPAGDLAAARLFRAVARTSLGDLALKQNNYPEAIKLYTEAAEIARADNRAELTWGAERGLGKAYWAMSIGTPNRPADPKNKDEAVKHYRAALNIIETLFAGSLRADDARTGFLATTKDVFDEAASALAELALKNAPAAPVPQDQALAHASNPTAAATLEGRALEYATEAFRVVEQGKARSLLDMLGDARAEVTEGLPAALVERKNTNMARQQGIANLLSGAAPKTLTPQRTVPELEAELEQLTIEFNSLENQIRSSSPRYSALMRTQPLTLAEVRQQVLDDSTVLLEYNLGTERSYLWTVTRDGLMLYRLPSRAVIERQAIELRQQLVPMGARRAIAGIDIENTRGLSDELTKAGTAATGRGLVLGGPATASANVSAYAEAAQALYELIIAPAAASIGNKRLLVVADGSLHYVPFEALVSSADGLDYSQLAYLIKTNEIVYAPSASVVAALRQQTRTGAARGGSMLVVADPVFDAGDARLKGEGAGAAQARESVQRMALQSALSDVTTLQTPGLKLVRLGGTRSEAEQIAKLSRAAGNQTDVWLDFDASEVNLHGRALSGYRVLHVATHGLLDAERPQFTGLALSLVGQKDADGFLRTDEIFNLKLGSPLVMLSACETGLGKERRGEGVIGLTRAFMYAGAPTVGVSLWSVADKSTAELMPDFYQHLLEERVGAPAAMRSAQLSMIAGKRYSAPFYWAPFVLVGDWH